MLKKLPLLLLLITATVASAQTNFRPGYVVTLDGDTLHGEVDSRGSQRNARLARYRPSDAASITDYQPQQLRGYGLVGDRVYQVDSVSVAVPPVPTAPYGAAPDTVQQPVFLEVLVRGALSLLYLRDELSNDHFYLSAAGKSVQELLPPPVRKIADDEVAYRNSANAFRRTMAAATQQCLALQSTVAAARYNQRSLSELVTTYNQCVGAASVSPSAAAYKTRVRIGLIGGAEVSRLVLNGQKSTYGFVSKGWSDKVSPVIGVALTVGLTRVNRTISARLEGFYESQSYLLRSQIAGSNTYNEFRVKLTSIRVPLLMRYTFPRGEIRPFAQAGFSFSYLLNNDNEERQVRIPANPNGYPASAWVPIVKPRTLEQGLIGSVGLATAWDNRRNARVELRYERSNGFSNAVGFGSRVNRFYLLLGYDLTK
ncbi:hypothetical protein CDA63_06510 [Hymenobacter amundsenii]|uniref:Outer membrane protein beta-barrel domain-containing protein n=1 Tax=Hymenobacter amundsenii TaxID=2006685 RepID=A0A246FME1_9BACT|nr:outer membrane beta-barrel protein [Hymenobacter amundsenii]OWP63859.1 hypothetical protein CDA63_06510 [Hymenobacter amundsenii]